MKINILSYFVLAALSLGGVCSCSSMNGEHVVFSSFPICLSGMENGSAESKVTAGGVWDGSERVAVKIGSDVKEYKVTGMSGKTATLEGISPQQTHFWNDKGNVVLSAWVGGNDYLTSCELVGCLTDQSTSSALGKADFLYAPETSISFGTESPLTFYHQMAKVRVNVRNDGEVSGVNPARVNVSFGDSNNYIGIWGTLEPSLIDAKNGRFSALQVRDDMVKGYVKTCRLPSSATSLCSFEALLIPQDMNGKHFITVTYNGDSYYYIPQAETILEGGYVKELNVKVTRRGLEVISSNISSWNDRNGNSGTAKEI